METMNEKNLATFTHLSTITQYFIPFGNYIFQLLIWNSKKDDSEFIDFHGKQALNFQLSLLLYSILLAIIAIPIFIITVFNHIPLTAVINEDDFLANYLSIANISGIVIIAIIAVIIFAVLKIVEFFLIIYACLKASTVKNTSTHSQSLSLNKNHKSNQITNWYNKKIIYSNKK
jgi:uncharacterized Tic20 family protein